MLYATHAAICGGGGTLLSIDIICHGTPSPALFVEHLSYLKLRLGAEPVSYEHRPKTRKWEHCEAVTLENGVRLQDTRVSESWKNLFYSNEFLRPACYKCPYTTTKRKSDITIADFWGIEDTRLSDFKDDLGVSLVLVNTERGQRVVEKLDSIDIKASCLEDALPKNPMLERPSLCKGDRRSSWTMLYMVGYAELLRKRRFVKSIPRSVGSKMKRCAKGLLGR